MANSPLEQLIDTLDPVFDQAIVDGNDDELFASGYLRGHFDLVGARLTMAGETDSQLLLPALEEAVQAASHELTPADLAHVESMLARLQQTAKQS